MFFILLLFLKLTKIRNIGEYYRTEFDVSYNSQNSECHNFIIHRLARSLKLNKFYFKNSNEILMTTT